MAVYVDDMRASYGRMKMCHMFADSLGELVEFAGRLGLAAKHIQYSGTYREHFDVCLAKRGLAISAGAREISRRQVAQMLQERRKTYRLTHSFYGGSVEISELAAPEWLRFGGRVGSTEDNRWFWERFVRTLKVGEFVDTDFHRITRTS